MTGASGTLNWYWRSDPFGVGSPTVIVNGSNYSIGMPGQYYDPEDQLYYNGARYYWSAVGRYYESDPIGLDGGINTYAYVSGNPILRADPLGLYWQYFVNTGALYYVNGGYNSPLVGVGYSGFGSGVNNPSAEANQFNGSSAGPIPSGSYTIDPCVDLTGGLGPDSCHLTPNPGNNIAGRQGGFWIHGDNAQHNNTASHGCIVLPEAVREQIANSPDRDLEVFDYDPNAPTD